MLWTPELLQAATGASSKTPFSASGISIDTRSLQPGDLFVALTAERDGHDFVTAALEKGAAGALISRDLGIPNAFIVEDTLAALRRLAAHRRAYAPAKITAVTGSVGKTTTKEMLRRTLAAFGKTHAADASFNNHIGVPLTLARMPLDAEYAVIELGMNHPGEILPLTRLTRPHAAIITSVERTHIGLMGSIEAIAAEKASIYLGLEPGGAAILPGDSPFLAALESFSPVTSAGFRFGATQGEAQLISAESDATSCAVTAKILGKTVSFRLAAPGRHMAMNAMAVLAACAALKLDIEKAASALDGFTPYAGRGLRKSLPNDILLLDESYNASAASVRAALAVLALQPGRHIAVLGDMLELGDDAQSEHESLSPDVDIAADLLFACGPMSRHLYEKLPAAKRGAYADTAAALAPLVKSALRPNDSVLVKGSYGSRMRDVVAVLEA